MSQKRPTPQHRTLGSGTRPCVASIRRARAMAAGLILMLASAAPALAIDAAEMFEDAARETRARTIGRELRCLVCQNQSIFDSNAELARDLRIVVRERMDAGDSDDEVLDYISDRFGAYVLLKPPVSPATYALWLAPVGFLLLGGGLSAVYLRDRARRPVPDTPLSEEDRSEARRLLSEGER